MSDCKACGSTVRWKQVNGVWQCFNPDGSVHWDLCSQKKFQRIKESGTHFTQRRDGSHVEGYKTMFKNSGEQLTLVRAKVVKAKRGRISGQCRECVPPWEVCASCPDAIRSAA